MPFSDDDLKRLKELIDPVRGETNGQFFYDEISALLARLEAAERYCETQDYKDRMAWKVSKGELTGKVRLMDGRKAAGKLD